MIRTIVCLALIGCFQLTGLCASPEEAAPMHMTKQQAIEGGLAALKAQYPQTYADLVATHGPFDAEVRDGIWLVSGTNPKGVRGGGAPTIELRDRDKKVLRIYFSR